MLEERILNEYKEALKARDALKTSVLSFLRAELLNAAVAKKKERLDDADVVAVVKKQIKQRQDSIEQFTKGGRIEMARKEEAEMQLLKGYLPEELSGAEIERIVHEAVAASGAQGMKDMGKVMKEVLARTSGKADGKLVSDAVKKRLGG